jgi:hypothetical protein
MNNIHSPYWFRAKRYGWGWGLPAAWQGWVVMITWVVAVAVAGPMLALLNWPLFFLYISVMVAALLAICFAKGEPPTRRWRDPASGQCPVCNKTYSAEAKFCPHCGGKI